MENDWMTDRRIARLPRLGGLSHFATWPVNVALPSA